MPIQFHLDENVAHSIATGLRQRGIDVTLPRDVDLLGATDEAHLAFAHQNGRVIVTHDDDFLALHRRAMPHAGIVYAPPQSRPISRLIRGLLLISEVLSQEDMENHVEFL